MAGRVRGARRVSYDGHNFASTRECKRYKELKLLLRARQISELALQVDFPLVIKGVPIRTATGRIMRYVADFTYLEAGKLVIEDAKGHATDVYRIKRAIVQAMGYDIREV